MKYWKRNIIRILLLISFLAAPCSSFADNYPKKPNIDVVHYTFDITLSDETDFIKATATILVKFKTNGIETLRLDLTNKSENFANKGMTVKLVISQGKTMPITHGGDVLLINLPPSLENEERSIIIEYEGIPDAGLKIGDNKYEDHTFFSDNWPNKARNWLPTVDHPYDKATSYNAKSKIIEIEINQLQPEKYTFNMPLELDNKTNEDIPSRRQIIQLNKRKVKISIPSDIPPSHILLDPETNLLAQWDFLIRIDL